MFKNEIKESILSAVYNAENKVNPYTTFGAKIEIKNSGLKLEDNLPYTLSFRGDKGNNILSASANHFGMIAIPYKNKIVNRKDFAIEQAKQEAGQVFSVKPVTIDGLEGYEIVAFNKEKDVTKRKKNYYQLLLYDTSKYYLINGVNESKTIRNKELDNIILQLKKIAHTFKRF